MKKILSICIPTYNRIECLRNCLESIYESKKNSSISYEVCISDNSSTENIADIINYYKDRIVLKYSRNDKNFGLGVNILNSVKMAVGEFVWIIGNDDLLLPQTLNKIDSLINNNSNIDFYYINSYHLSSEYVKKFSQPFDTKLLLKNMKKFSNYKQTKKVNFFNLVDPKISFDFMLGMFLCIFRREKWNKNLDVINKNLISDLRTYSSFDNTCPHIKIWAKSFRNSKAIFYEEPLSVNLHGEREWFDLYPFIEAIRIPQVVDEYRKYGLNFFRYLYCKNYALRKLIPSLFKMIIKYKKSNIQYVSIKKDILMNLLYPSIYFGAIYYLIRKIIKVLLKIN
jgi:glycosyltransferase involved in cell wall biosynthesis